MKTPQELLETLKKEAIEEQDTVSINIQTAFHGYDGKTYEAQVSFYVDEWGKYWFDHSIYFDTETKLWENTCENLEDFDTMLTLAEYKNSPMKLKAGELEAFIKTL